MVVRYPEGPIALKGFRIIGGSSHRSLELCTYLSKIGPKSGRWFGVEALPLELEDLSLV